MPENQQHEARIAVLEKGMNEIEKRQDKMEAAVEEIKKTVWKGIGILAALGFIVELIEIVLRYTPSQK